MEVPLCICHVCWPPILSCCLVWIGVLLLGWRRCLRPSPPCHVLFHAIAWISLPFREWNFAFRELLREYPGTLRELREWPFHSETPRMAFSLREHLSWNWDGPQASELRYVVVGAKRSSTCPGARPFLVVHVCMNRLFSPNRVAKVLSKSHENCQAGCREHSQNTVRTLLRHCWDT